MNDLDHSLAALDAAILEPPGVPKTHATSTALAVTTKPDVTGVQASIHAGSAVTADDENDVIGVTPEPVVPEVDQRPLFKIFDDPILLPDGTTLKAGVWFFGVKAGRKADDPPSLTQQWVCSPLHVEAVTLDGQQNNFGRLLRFKTTIGTWRTWAMPMELLRGAGDELRGELLAMGVEIDPLAARTLLAQHLQAKPPDQRIQCALQVGWSGENFVLPDAVIGPTASAVVFQSGERGHDEFTCAGSLAGWQADVSSRAIGNPLGILALSAAFAGPMLARCNSEGGGIHLVGDSSTGKTTLIEMACSVWGGAGYRRSWRTTANGMEGAASLFNDLMLALDEISECDPKDVGAIVYALGNGRGKQRASRTGNARSVTRWRCFVLSSGERTIGTAMAEGGFRAKAGQSVRLLDIPASRRFGAWDALDGFSSGAALSDAIKRASITQHGHAGRAFLEKLTHDGRDFCEWLDRVKALPEFISEGEGQDKRAAARFAMVALAGELATEYGITNWEEGAAIEAAAMVYKTWKSLRGVGNDEKQQITGQVAAFIERHGDSRFSDIDSTAPFNEIRNNRAGWWCDKAGKRVYLFTAEGLRESVKGHDFKRALDMLEKVGALQKVSTGGERATPHRIGGRLVRLYTIHPDKLEQGHGA
jgi:putative DNA primase/helicase